MQRTLFYSQWDRALKYDAFQFDIISIEARELPVSTVCIPYTRVESPMKFV